MQYMNTAYKLKSILKNIVSLSLIFLIAFSLAACGHNKHRKDAQQSNITPKKLPSTVDALDALKHEDTDALYKILEKNPKLANSKDDNGYPLLHIAIWENNARCAKIILNAKGDPESIGPYGFAAIHEVVRCDETNDRREILEMLIVRRADVNALTASGNTPLDIAEIGDKQDFTRTLKRYGGKRVKQTLDLPPVPPFARDSNELNE